MQTGMDRNKIVFLTLIAVVILTIFTVYNHVKMTTFNRAIDNSEADFVARVLLNPYLTITDLEVYVYKGTAFYHVNKTQRHYETGEIVKSENAYIIRSGEIESILNINWTNADKEPYQSKFDFYEQAQNKGKCKVYTKEEICDLLISYNSETAASGNSKEELLERHK